METRTDEQLVINYQQGDAKALDLLIQRHLKPLYNFVFKYAHTIEDTEDITQEAFVKIWKNINKFNSRYKFKTWAYTIAKNTALDHLKKRGLIPFSELNNKEGELQFDETLISHDPMPEKIMANIEDMGMINMAVDKLPLKYREIISLYYHDQLTLREISELLSQSINTVKTRHRRAITQLRQILLSK